MLDDIDTDALFLLLMIAIAISCYFYVYQNRDTLQSNDITREGHQENQTSRNANNPIENMAQHKYLKKVDVHKLTGNQISLHDILPNKYGARIITCDAENLIGNASNPKIDGETVRIVKDLVAISDFYVLGNAKTDETEVKIQKAFEKAGLLFNKDNGDGIPPHRLMFFSNVNGKIAMVRQMEPQVHIEVTPYATNSLQKFIPCLIYVSGTPQDIQPVSNLNSQNRILFADTFISFFTTLEAVR